MLQLKILRRKIRTEVDKIELKLKVSLNKVLKENKDKLRFKIK